MKLTKYEKETIINYNQAESTATIYTHDADLKRRLAKYSKQHPDICKADKETREGSVSYTIDKIDFLFVCSHLSARNAENEPASTQNSMASRVALPSNKLYELRAFAVKTAASKPLF